MIPAPAKRVTRAETLAVVGVTAAVWILNSQFVVLRPVLWFATYVHEAMHAFTAMVLGLSVQSVTINAHGGGLTYSTGHRSTFQTIVVGSAGYMGAAIAGAVSLELCKRLRTARIACVVIAALIAAVGLLWVPWHFKPDVGGAILTGSTSGDGRFTTVFWIVAALVFVGLAIQPIALARRVVLLVVSTALCLLSIESLKVVLDWSSRGGDSDASTVAHATFLSSWMWSAMWLLFGIALCVLSVWSLVVGDEKRAEAREVTSLALPSS